MSPTRSDVSGIGAVRGAVSIPSNQAEDIRAGTARLLETLLEVNGIVTANIVSAFFTATSDLNADFPAHAARRLGWNDVPLLCAREIDVPGAMPRVVRVLLTVSGVTPGARLTPVYLGDAARLRPDLAPPARAAVGREGAGEERSERRVALIGVGQIGGSIGLDLGARGGWRRVGFDLDRATLDRALVRGAIDEARASIAEACAGADLALLAVPVDALPDAIRAAAAALPPGAALIDTGSARAGVTPALEAAAAAGIRAVGGHPIAGVEGHGFEAARAGLFAGAPFAVSPLGGEVPEVVERMIEDLGARIVRVAPAEHDHALARTSHLPYLVAAALHGLGEDAARRGLSGPGFRDMTRLAASDARVALAYCRANAAEVASAWRELRARLDARIESLAGGG
jgi:monofunctional chorismate mutase